MTKTIKLNPKREDKVLLSGRACFADDVHLTNPLHITFLRAQIAHGHVDDIDIFAANSAFAVHTYADVAHLNELSVNPVIPIKHALDFPILTNQITAVGQPIAAVLAGTPDLAQDVAEQIEISLTETRFEPQTIASKRWKTGDIKEAFASAAHIVSCSINHPRLAPSPIEPRAISIKFIHECDAVTVWHSTQTPHRTRSELANILDIDLNRIHVIAQHVGGAFGMKASLYPEEVFAVWAAFQHKRDVKWAATRSEDFLSATHGRALVMQGRLAIDAQGKFTALKAEITAPIGPWLPNSGLIPAWNGARILPSGYRIEALDITTQAVTDGRGPNGIYRGAGRPEANMLIERLIDKAGLAIGLDPFEIRRRNVVTAQDLPHVTATENTLDSGDYTRVLEMLKNKSNYDSLKENQKVRRENGELVGIGVGFYLEPSGEGWEAARVTLTQSGATIASGSSSQGHARETAYAKIAGDALGLDPDQITVILGDTNLAPAGVGALASRSTAIGGSAVEQACEQLENIANTDTSQSHTCEIQYHADGQAWGYGAYLAVVSICAETGTLVVEKVICVDDAGRIINPDLVRGQILGGLVQGLGEATLEHIEYDDDNQLLTGSFMDYAMPRATDIPPVEIYCFETPSPMNKLGAKGVGEAGTIAAPLTIMNAAVDALMPLGITDLQMPLTSHALWQAMQSALRGKPL